MVKTLIIIKLDFTFMAIFEVIQVIILKQHLEKCFVKIIIVMDISSFVIDFIFSNLANLTENVIIMGENFNFMDFII